MQGLELSTQDLKADEKTAPTITISTVVEAANIENIAERVADALRWESSDSKVAVIKGVTSAIITGGIVGMPADGADSVEETVSGQDSIAVEAAEPHECIVELNVEISALKEGEAVLTFAIGEQETEFNICVEPVPVALAQCTNLQWKNVTVLY